MPPRSVRWSALCVLFALASAVFAGPPAGTYSLLGRNNFRLGKLELLGSGDYTVNGAGKGKWAFVGNAVKFTGGVYGGKSAPYSDEGSWHKLQMNACANGSHMIGSKPK